MRDHIADIISGGCIPADWQESYIINLYTGKYEALNKNSTKGVEVVMKMMEHVVKGLIRQRDEIDEMQCDSNQVVAPNMQFYCMSPTEEAHDC